MVINVSISKDVALVAWRRTAWLTGLCAAVAVGFVLLLIRAQLRQFQRLERSERLLANRNSTLEATQGRLRQQADELTASRAAEAEQAGALEAALAHMNQGIMMVEASGRVAVCNTRAAAMLGLPAGLVQSRPLFGEIVAFQRAAGEFVKNPVMPSIEERMARPGTYERERPDGRVLEVQTVPMDGGGMVRTYTDITERRQSERQVQFLASHDPLTGLLNRAGFHDRFAALIGEAALGRQHLAVYYLDLDGFKPVNDTYGHTAGDKLLAAVAERLRAATRAGDVVARMGGDEFAVIQPFQAMAGALTQPSVTEFAQRMLAAVVEPFRLGDVRCSVGVSIGGGGVSRAFDGCGGAAAAGRHRAVPGQGGGQGGRPGVRPGRGRRATLGVPHGAGPGAGVGGGAVLAALPAHRGRADAAGRAVRGAAALDPPGPRAGVADRVHRGRRGVRADRADRAVGAGNRVRDGGGVAVAGGGLGQPIAGAVRAGGPGAADRGDAAADAAAPCPAEP